MVLERDRKKTLNIELPLWGAAILSPPPPASARGGGCARDLAGGARGGGSGRDLGWGGGGGGAGLWAPARGGPWTGFHFKLCIKQKT